MSDDIRGPVISAIAGFLAVLVGTAVVPWVREYFSRRQAARYLAIRMVCILDKYVDDCAAVTSDWGSENQEGFSEPQVSLPPMPSYPKDVNWHSIEYSLMYDILSLPTAADKARSIVSGASEFADPPDYQSFFETRTRQFAALGLKAFELTKRLRKRYHIPDIDRTDWDSVGHINEQLQKLKEIEERRKVSWELPFQSIPEPRPDIAIKE